MSIPQPTLRIPGLPPAAEAFVDKGLQARAYAALRALLATPPQRKEPPFRVGADLVIELLQDDGTYRRYEIIANGSLVRDPESRETWPFRMGQIMLRDAVPRLISAAASAERTRNKAQDHGR